MGINLPSPPAQTSSPLLRPVEFTGGESSGRQESSKHDNVLESRSNEKLQQRRSIVRNKATAVRMVVADDNVANAAFKFMVQLPEAL